MDSRIFLVIALLALFSAFAAAAPSINWLTGGINWDGFDDELGEGHCNDGSHFHNGACDWKNGTTQVIAYVHDADDYRRFYSRGGVSAQAIKGGWHSASVLEGEKIIVSMHEQEVDGRDVLICGAPAWSGKKEHEYLVFTAQCDGTIEFRNNYHETAIAIIKTDGAKIPQALNVSIFPQNPLEGEVLYCIYNYFDTLGESEGATTVKWFRDGALTPYRGITINSGITRRLELWKCEVTPKSSGGRTGFARQSSEVLIGFSTPNISLEGIPDASIPVNKTTGTGIADLWQFAHDSHDTLSQLQFSIVSQSNSALINCGIQQNRFVSCGAPAANQIGSNEVTVKVRNSLGQEDTDAFRVNVVNTAPAIAFIPDQHIRKNSGATTHLLDLFNYIFDAEHSDDEIAFMIVSQSNASLVSCSISSSRFIDCNAPAANAAGTSAIRLKATDTLGLFSERGFNIVVSSAGPALAELSEIHIKKNAAATSRAIDLWQFASDEDNADSELAFSIISQSNSGLVNCSIESNRYISCGAPAANRTGLNVASVQVRDPDGAVDSRLLDIFVEDTGFNFSFDKSRLVLEPGQTASAIVTLENTSGERKCFTLRASASSYSDIEAKLPSGMNSLCLNADERTSFNFSVHAFDDAGNDDYTATLRVSDGTNETSKSIEVEVSEDEKDIDLIAYTKNVCRNRYNQAASVLVRNNTGSTQAIKLSAESELFLPSFEPEEIELEEGEERYVELKLNLNSTTALGGYSIPVFAEASGKEYESRANFSVIDCETPRKKILDLIVPSGCVSVEKGKSAVVSFRVKNLSSGLQNVSLAETGDLVADLSRKTAQIEPRSSVNIDMNIHTNFDTANGRHTMSVWAWNDSDRVGGDLCVEVGKVHKIDVEQLNNNIEIARDDAGIYSFNISNLGDYSETATVSVLDSLPKITVTVSKPSVLLSAGETKNVFVVVAPSLDSELGAREINVRFSGAGQTITKKINFTVVKETTQQKLNVIKVLGQPSVIKARPGTKANFTLVLENPTNEAITGLNVIVTGLPDDANSAAIVGINLNAKEHRTVYGTIEFGENAKAGDYSAAFEIKNAEYKTVAPFKIVVENPLGFLSGLFGLASSIVLGLVALVVVIFIIVLASKSGASRGKPEPWLAQKAE